MIKIQALFLYESYMINQRIYWYQSVSLITLNCVQQNDSKKFLEIEPVVATEHLTLKNK